VLGRYAIQPSCATCAGCPELRDGWMYEFTIPCEEMLVVFTVFIVVKQKTPDNLPGVPVIFM